MLLPFLLTLSRIVATPIIIFFIFKENFLAAGLLFLFASITDVLDGWIARRSHATTNLGKWLDPIADKILIIGTALSVFLKPTDAHLFIPDIPIPLFFSRDIIAVLGSIFTLFMGEWRTFIHVNRMGKATTVLQILTIVILLFELYDINLPNNIPASDPSVYYTVIRLDLMLFRFLFFLTCVVSTFSALSYFFSFFRQWRSLKSH